jgi:hypothetical protein
VERATLERHFLPRSGWDRVRLQNVRSVRYDLASHTGRPRPGRSALRALGPPYSLRAVAHRREGICHSALLCALLSLVDFVRPSVSLALGHSAPRCAARLASRSPSFQLLCSWCCRPPRATDMLRAPLRMGSLYRPLCNYTVRRASMRASVRTPMGAHARLSWCVHAIILSNRTRRADESAQHTRTCARWRQRCGVVCAMYASCAITHARCDPHAAAAIWAACAGAYALGASNTNACPSGSFKIDTASACESAAAAVDGLTYIGNDTLRVSPSGCFLNSADIVNLVVIFNAAAPGAAASHAQPLCKSNGGPPQPPPPAHLRGYTAGGVVPW